MSKPIVRDPSFPARPTAEQIAAEYTPERVMQLCRYVASRIRHLKHDYDEVVQEAALSFYTRVAQYNAGEVTIPDSYPFYYWLLFRILTDVKDVRYREPRRLNGRKVEHLTKRSTYTELAESDPDQGEKMDVLEAIDQLTPQRRRAVELYFFEGMGQSEIAELLGIAQKNVHSLLSRAKKNLGNHLRLEDL